eukprot:6171927-Pleurochrysis_carterae.AAC.3
MAGRRAPSAFRLRETRRAYDDMIITRVSSWQPLSQHRFVSHSKAQYCLKISSWGSMSYCPSTRVLGFALYFES